jgi:hypothetical protein
MSPVNGKVAPVTGAANGIGAARRRPRAEGDRRRARAALGRSTSARIDAIENR